jgi:hypothetical protein
MTVRELIEHLAEFGDDAIIATNNYSRDMGPQLNLVEKNQIDFDYVTIDCDAHKVVVIG